MMRITVTDIGSSDSAQRGYEVSRGTHNHRKAHNPPISKEIGQVI